MNGIEWALFVWWEITWQPMTFFQLGIDMDSAAVLADTAQLLTNPRWTVNRAEGWSHATSQMSNNRAMRNSCYTGTGAERLDASKTPIQSAGLQMLGWMRGRHVEQNAFIPFYSIIFHPYLYHSNSIAFTSDKYSTCKSACSRPEATDLRGFSWVWDTIVQTLRRTDIDRCIESLSLETLNWTLFWETTFKLQDLKMT